MPDWPSASSNVPTGGVINSCRSPGSAISDNGLMSVALAAAAWPAANRALYIPFMVDQTVIAYQMAFEVGAQAGNCDVGIYDVLGNRLVSKGSTAIGPAGLQKIDITDTTLTPGVYFMAMNCDTVTTLTISRTSGFPAQLLQGCGMQQQAVGAVTLPNPATFANPASAYVPDLAVALKSVI